MYLDTLARLEGLAPHVARVVLDVVHLHVLVLLHALTAIQDRHVDGRRRLAIQANRASQRLTKA